MTTARHIRAAARRVGVYPLHLGRERGIPVVAKRLAGSRCEIPGPTFEIYRGATSTHGELGMATWYRMRDAGPYSRPDAWRIGIQLDLCSADGYGTSLHRDAVVNDFGDLVIVGQ